MFKLLAMVFYVILLYAVIKYLFSRYIIKENVESLNRKFNEHGPFYDIDWDKKGEDA